MGDPLLTLSRFMATFSGLKRAYGKNDGGRCTTIKRDLGIKQWEDHLSGRMGLGVIAVTDEGMVEWGSIDIDAHKKGGGDPTFNPIDVARKVAQLGLPLIVCRSKSGGAHCHYFLPRPTPAGLVIAQLKSWSALLGFGESEIFPKQAILRPGDVGNWINLPYFKAASTDRYAIDPDGNPLTLEEFLNHVDSVKEAGSKPTTPSAAQATGEGNAFPGMPPCLKIVMAQGIPEGARNDTLFNFGVYFRKSMDSEAWPDALMAFNQEYIDPPLSYREVQAMIKSVDRRTYAYRCGQAPIDKYCNKAECKMVKWGISSMSDIQYGDIVVGALSKIMTIPPRWELEVNGVFLSFDTDTIMDHRKFRKSIFETLDMVIPPMKGEEWLSILQDKLANKVEIDAPPDASVPGQLIAHLRNFLKRAERAKSSQDILMGLPWAHKEKEVIYFKSQDFLTYLKQQRVQTSEGAAFWDMLRRSGCGHARIKIRGAATQVWSYKVRIEKAEDLEPQPPTSEF